MSHWREICLMLNNNNLDLNIILSFANHYEKLEQKGEITEKQLEKVLSLLDDIENISKEKLQKKINEIF